MKEAFAGERGMKDVLSLSDLPAPEYIWGGLEGELCLLYDNVAFMWELQDQPVIFSQGSDICYDPRHGFYLEEIGRLDALEGVCLFHVKRATGPNELATKVFKNYRKA
jgi:hypothetical protein